VSAGALASLLEQLARDEGFLPPRFARAEPLAEQGAQLDTWLAAGFHADMHWMARQRDDRCDPRRVLPGTRTVVALAMPYGHPRPDDPGGLTGQVSRYAWGRDYHRTAGEALERMQRRLAREFPELSCTATVDTRPVPERAWAQRAGLGFIGHNSCLIAPGHGSYLFLACLLLSAQLPPHPEIEPDCGACTRCLQACPTGALVAPGQLDARRCLSYLGIEHRGDIPEQARPAMGRQVFGCDRCQQVCPHQRPERAGHPDFEPQRAWLPLDGLLLTDDQRLEQDLAGSAIRRARAAGLKRNACVVLGNIGDSAALPALEPALAHTAPMVRRHAAWAAVRCGGFALVKAALLREDEHGTRAAMERALRREV